MTLQIFQSRTFVTAWIQRIHFRKHRSILRFISTQESSSETPPASLLDNWKEYAQLNPRIEFPTILVEAPDITRALGTFREHLASKFPLLQHLHQRIKLVQDYNETHKLILLHPSAVIKNTAIQDGPVIPIQFTYQQFTANYTLHQLLPKHVHPPPSSFETVGHVAHLNLRESHLPYRYLIGHVLLETLPRIETVIHKIGQVQGPFRTYDFELLAGRNDTQVEVVEAGVRMRFDLRDVYWCSRLSQERRRLLDQFGSNTTIADPFCGVGALLLQAAKERNCTIWANDWNPRAIESLRDNFACQGLSPQLTRVQCGDAYDFLMDLGLEQVTSNDIQVRLPDHVVMNYPLESAQFLGALRWWPVSESSIVPRVHVYTFARADGDRTAEDVAVDLVAENLLPMGTTRRRDEMNQEYDCQVEVHAVRDVAPGKLVFCVSFSATGKLLRFMQGDFS